MSFSVSFPQNAKSFTTVDMNSGLQAAENKGSLRDQLERICSAAYSLESRMGSMAEKIRGPVPSQGVGGSLSNGSLNTLVADTEDVMRRMLIELETIERMIFGQS